MSELNNPLPDAFIETGSVRLKDYHKNLPDTAFSSIKEGDFMDWQKEFIMCRK